MKYGQFNAEGTEFVVTNPATPRPWINYLTNEDYCAIVSQTAGGYSFYKDCRTGRMLRWSPENWHFDRPGRYIYVRDKASGAYWSAMWQPVKAAYEKFESRHGLGYTTVQTVVSGVKTETTFFVPSWAGPDGRISGDPCEVWISKVTNTSKKTKNLQLFPYVEWLMGDFHEELRYRNIMILYNRAQYDKKLKAVLAKKTAVWADMNIQAFPGSLFFGSSLPVKRVSTRKDSFLGRLRTEERPESVEKGSIENFEFTSGEDSIAAFQHELTLKPGESKEFAIVLGQTDQEENVSKLLTKYRDLPKAKAALASTQALWKEKILNNIRIQTPDKDFDQIMNIWVKYQTYVCNLWSRSPSFYHEGGGGRGYRDSCQDSEGILSINPELARRKIMTIVKLIREDGTSAPGWSDTKGPAQHRPNKDHPVWLTVTVASFIKETGEKNLLLEKAPYLKDKWVRGWDIDKTWKGGPQAVGEGTVFEHLWKNLDFTFNDTGERGLPKIGHADWNDAIDAAGIKHKGESVWLAQALVRSLKILAELAELINEKDKAAELRARAQTMTDRIEKAAWNGDWYTYGFTDDGMAYGAKENKEGKISLNTQSWAILAGIPNAEQTQKILAAVDKNLDGPHGYALFSPAYSSWVKNLGRISMFTEGTKENAAVFCHAATFMVVANCLSGRGTKAYQSMRKIMPNAQKDMEVYKAEPYAYAEYLFGPEHPYAYGEGAFTWITGTAAWTFMAATEWLLGVRHDYDGLLIDPCLPAAWKKASVRRPFRGNLYDITIENPQGVEKGVKQIFVDGKPIQGRLIVPQGRGKTVSVRVVMGSAVSSNGVHPKKSGTRKEAAV